MSDKNNFKILVIDDNPSIHRDFIKILKTESSNNELDHLSKTLFNTSEDKQEYDLPQFEIDSASQGQEGVMRIKEAMETGSPYALAFVDIRMPPGWDGIETIKHIWELDKDVQVVICTAYSDYSWEETVAHLGRNDNLLILKKPFDSISVRQLACALTTKWQLAEESRNFTRNLQQQVMDRTVSLQESLSLIKSTFESSSDGILIVNNEGSIIDYNNKLLKLLNIPYSVIDSRSETELLNFLRDNILNPDEFFSRIRELKNNSQKTNIDIIHFRNGKIFECYSQPHKHDGQTIGHILDFRDVTQRATLEKELQYQATHDPLTGLGNRILLLSQLKASIKIASQNNARFAVLFIDLDRFKLINDSLSHDAGDNLLKVVAHRLQGAIRTEDTLVRLGGDEFVIILMNVEKKEHVEEKVNRLIRVFQNPMQVAGRQITMTSSIGISLFPEHGTSMDILLRNADAAMYKAKAQKGNNYKFYYPEMNDKSLALLDQETELRRALVKKELVLYYQPQIDLNSESLVAVEALVRWNHPTKGIILPVDFIPLAEETGLIMQINEWVLKTACEQNVAWQKMGFPPIRVAVNLSVQQFKQSNLVNVIQQTLMLTGLEPKYLELELTENIILSSSEIIKTLTELKELGVIISIDDFGTGYSSLSYLHKIPLDRLKIDGSFIQHIHSATDDEVIIRAVISMAKNLNLEVLAEGVETIDQLNFLKKNECGDVQGFYFSKPLSSDDLEQYFKHPVSVKELISMHENTDNDDTVNK